MVFTVIWCESFGDLEILSCLKKFASFSTSQTSRQIIAQYKFPGFISSISRNEIDVHFPGHCLAAREPNLQLQHCVYAKKGFVLRNFSLGAFSRNVMFREGRDCLYIINYFSKSNRLEIILVLLWKTVSV
jgi:hypothetical protein